MEAVKGWRSRRDETKGEQMVEAMEREDWKGEDGRRDGRESGDGECEKANRQLSRGQELTAR